MGKIARVYVNQVEVGSLPADQYESIAKAARKDLRLWVLQGGNLLVAAFRFVAGVLRLAPLACFIISIVALVLVPDIVTHFFGVIATATPAEATRIYALVVVTGVVMATVSNLLAVAFGWQYQYGYVNQVDRVINQKLRQILEVPAEGDMTIICVEIDGQNHHGE